jgi:hypothetical protein
LFNFRELFDILKKKKKVKLLDSNILQPSPRHNHKFPKEIIDMIKDMQKTFKEVYPITMDEWIAGFDRDSNPEREIAFWLYMADVYKKLIKIFPDELEYRKEIYKIILACSMGDDKYVISQAKVKKLSESDVRLIIKEFRKK